MGASVLPPRRKPGRSRALFIETLRLKAKHHKFASIGKALAKSDDPKEAKRIATVHRVRYSRWLGEKRADDHGERQYHRTAQLSACN